METTIEILHKELGISKEFVKIFYDENNGDMNKTREALKAWIKNNIAY